MNLPMPNQRLLRHDGLVVASCDQENGQVVVLVLNPHPPFYSVLHLDERLSVDVEEEFPNIIPAAEFYCDAIGGY